MNTNISKKQGMHLVRIVLLALMAMLYSCEKYDDLPPIKKQESANRIYKLPEPKAMTAEDKAKEQKIKEEYENAKQ